MRSSFNQGVRTTPNPMDNPYRDKGDECPHENFHCDTNIFKQITPNGIVYHAHVKVTCTDCGHRMMFPEHGYSREIILEMQA